jgi:hypothetical protein
MLPVGRTLFSAFGVAAVIVAAAAAQPPAPAAQPAPPALAFVPIHAIAPPAHPLPFETESASVTRFSFIAYGDTRSGRSAPGEAPVPGDGDVVHPIHSQIVDTMIARIEALKATPFPIRFVVQSGDSVLRGPTGAQWNVSYSPIVERLTQGAGVPYFFSAGNHDVTGMPAGDPARMMGLHNTLSAMSRLIPPEGSPRRLAGYPTYSVAFGNTFLIALDSNIASDALQLAWVADQLEHLDRARYRHVVAFFHHPPFSSGPHGGPNHVEPPTQAIRTSYMPLFRTHHVRLIVAGHDHLFDHFVERYDDNGAAHRIDAIVTGGGGAPLYGYSGEPDLTGYLADGAAQNVRVEHLVRPSPIAAENPHHFVVIQVDGEQLSLEVVGIDAVPYAPYSGSARIQLSNRGS